MTKKSEQPEAVWPKGLSQPAIRALTGAGYTRVEQLVNADENVIAGLHGMGPKGVRILREILAEKGLSFAGK